MSKRNGDRARFHKERKRKLLRRQRTKALIRAEALRVSARTGVDRPFPLTPAVVQSEHRDESRQP